VLVSLGLGCSHDFSFLDHRNDASVPSDSGDDTGDDSGDDAADAANDISDDPIVLCHTARLGDCNPITLAGCEAGQTCFDDGLHPSPHYICGKPGIIEAGDECPATPGKEDCVAGCDCLHFAHAPYTCVQFCCTDDECANLIGTSCSAVVSKTPFRLCY
jgi:hypothetical protein